MKRFIPLLILFTGLALASCGDGNKYALIETEYGDMKVMLYNSTPIHRDNFVKLVKEGFYDSLLFHRVIENFMIQGGDPASKNAKPGARLGGGGPGYQLDAEIGAPHIRGTLAAARNNNPEKKSSGSQFYIVHGQKQRDEQLDNFERQKNIKYNEEQRRLYKEVGGAPALDQLYTVFGEVVEGIEVVDKIAKVEKDRSDRPANDVRMKIRMVKK